MEGLPLFFTYAIILWASAYIIAALSRGLLHRLFDYTSKRRKMWHLRLRHQGIEVHDNHAPVLDETKYRIVSRLISGFIYFIAFGVFIYLIPPLRTLSYSWLAGAGVAAVVIGFAVQKSIANLVAGVFIALYEPFRIGDWITVENHYGIVEDITLRHTVLRGWENKRWIIPNSIIADNTVENFSIIDDRFLRVFSVHISFDADIDKARKVILEEVYKYPEVIVPEKTENGKLVKKEPFVRVKEWKENGLELQVGFWTQHVQSGWPVEYALKESIKKRFDKTGIEIPYPHRIIITQKRRKQR